MLFLTEYNSDFQHKIYRLAAGNKLYMAPIKNPKHVLDVATGTGIWAMEFSQDHPGAQVLGTDLSPIQPE
jgi:ubiquinone/menaquinone biosynthesis C-methylase UbiE